MKGNNILKAEYRAEPIKTLEEKRGGLISEMEQLIGKAKAEVRAFTDEEQTKRNKSRIWKRPSILSDNQ